MLLISRVQSDCNGERPPGLVLSMPRSSAWCQTSEAKPPLESQMWRFHETQLNTWEIRCSHHAMYSDFFLKCKAIPTFSSQSYWVWVDVRIRELYIELRGKQDEFLPLLVRSGQTSTEPESISCLKTKAWWKLASRFTVVQKCHCPLEPLLRGCEWASENWPSQENQNTAKPPPPTGLQISEQATQATSDLSPSPCIGKTTSSVFLFMSEFRASLPMRTPVLCILRKQRCETVSHTWTLHPTSGFAFNPKVFTSFQVCLRYHPASTWGGVSFLEGFTVSNSVLFCFWNDCALKTFKIICGVFNFR